MTAKEYQSIMSSKAGNISDHLLGVRSFSERLVKVALFVYKFEVPPPRSAFYPTSPNNKFNNTFADLLQDVALLYSAHFVFSIPRLEFPSCGCIRHYTL